MTIISKLNLLKRAMLASTISNIFFILLIAFSDLRERYHDVYTILLVVVIVGMLLDMLSIIDCYNALIKISSIIEAQDGKNES